MNKTFSESKMISKIKKFCNSEIKHLQVQKTAYSNHVYFFVTDNGSFMYKEYIEDIGIVDKTEELKIQLQIGFPKILFFEHNYRIEKFVQSDPVNFIADLQMIAKKLKSFHKMSIQCKNTHKAMLDKIIEKQFSYKIESTYTTNALIPQNNDDDVKILNVLQNKNEFLTYKNRIKKREVEYKLYNKIKQQVLDVIKSEDNSFCHNDLQIGNMIKVGETVEFIYFEYASYGNKYVDIANFFCETMCDYTKGCTIKEEIGLTKSQKLTFLSFYDPKNNAEALLYIIDKMACFSHFYWYMWARYIHLNNCGPSKNFDYKKYAMCRLEFLLKLNIIDEKEYKILQL
ncbi:hypothetical protein BDAP_000196 [Binucleata daphniae]